MTIKPFSMALSALAFVVVSVSPALSQNAMTPGGGLAAPNAAPGSPSAPAMTKNKAFFEKEPIAQQQGAPATSTGAVGTSTITSNSNEPVNGIGGTGGGRLTFKPTGK